MLHNIPVAFLGNEKKYVAGCMESGWISSAGKYVELFGKPLPVLRRGTYDCVLQRHNRAASRSARARRRTGRRSNRAGTAFIAANSVVHCAARAVSLTRN